MNKSFLALTLLVTLVAVVIVFKNKTTTNSSLHPLNHQQTRHQYVIAQAHALLGFDLLDPNQAPLNNRDSVLRGYRIIMNTPFYAPNYARDQLSCTHCHFAEGDTIGGKNNGLSLVGVTAVYPKFSKRDERVISLAERINACFERSLNGNPLPVDSQEMQDLLNYLAWISKEVQHLPSIPWLGIQKLKTKHQPNPDQGAIDYQQLCASCHKNNGQGGGEIEGLGKTIPPLWGANSFNDGAGMSRLPMLAAFIYWNMPYQDASLTEEQALDIASFILKQPRSHFIPK